MKTKITLTKKDCVVVFICAVFLVMCMGAIGGGSRKHAKDIVCRSNLRQWYLAMSEFTNDNDGSLWRGFLWNPCPSVPPVAQSIWWMAALKNYHGDIDKIRFCPTTKPRWAEDGVTPGPGWGKEPFAAWGHNSWLDANSPFPDCDSGSYAVNGWIENSWDDCSSFAPKWWRNINTIANAETVPFLLDGQWIDAWPQPNQVPPEAENMNWQDNTSSHFVRILQNRHEEAENCAFMDGTVRKVGLKELWTLKWHREFNTEGMWTLAGGATSSMWPGWMQDMEAY